MAYQELISADKCLAGCGVFVELDGIELAVFRLAEPEQIVVIDNSCPHASGNLSGGCVEGTVVACPWHDWKFDLLTGVCTHSAAARVGRYPAEVRQGQVWVDLAG